MSDSFASSTLLRAVLDANVLAYLSLVRLLLRLSRNEGLFNPCWSQQILEETWRTYAVKFGHGAQYASARLAEIVAGFSDALQSDLEPLIARCTNDAKDRHVLAAVIKADARVIVTFNDKHFSPNHLGKWNVVAIHPDDFLLELYAKNPQAMWRQISVGAEQKGMELDEFVQGYSEQLGRFKTALLADLP